MNGFPGGLLTGAQMRQLERTEIDSGRVTGARLMERAGRAVVGACLRAWPELATGTHRAEVLCGPGNNGGDGFVIARRLAERGWSVRLRLLGDVTRLPPDAARMAALWRPLGAILPLEAPAPEKRPDLVVDALFGTGLARPLSGTAADLVAGLRGARVVAVDIPSGLCADSGRVLGQAVRADLTVSFHAAKQGHFLGEGPALCGRLEVADIGLPQGAVPGALPLAEPDTEALSKRQGAKFDHGHAVMLAGGVGHGGAARMAARAALRVGAGLVTLAPPPAALIENAARLDAVMLHALRDGAALTDWLQDRRIRALGLGPGLGLGAREAGLVAAALDWGGPLVLDADALTLLSRDAALAARLHEGCLLTPHLGEFRRMFPDLAAQLTEPATSGPAVSARDVAEAAAERCGAVVLLKGPATVIAAPGGGVWLSDACYDRAAPDLATAGSGDVLAGLALGLLARGMAPAAAATTAAWLHVECGRALGPGLIAEDLPEALPGVLKALLA
ncbi:NAD(P)H-hydrate dehydratase [Pseudooceanicola nanhaiensis]|uniref:NAD(P)H-hydrate dehydratase n=1 Tax=Pseudooceanicola nanhaiensis TaxID=375761 RepID=UPI001CD7E7EF|nr:NAD(P)H-hydrate dehydratase [Pseudooceanicola nanhaiensis]MCA0919686.1 NAD(P)H-hydrate dehydratase [Pseudooceanicola nanhaiensis]